ncbi:MAG: hypothetical protein EBS69_02660 [Verrucomicrobia bacterium]|nr:hypothetical protein [Verrucomicrobiota bacterium]
MGGSGLGSLLPSRPASLPGPRDPRDLPSRLLSIPNCGREAVRSSCLGTSICPSDVRKSKPTRFGTGDCPGPRSSSPPRHKPFPAKFPRPHFRPLPHPNSCPDRQTGAEPMSRLQASVTDSTRRLLGFLERTQLKDGSWSVPYTGPNFERAKFVAGLLRPQRKDGSIGLHEESERGAVFTSSISYVALRLLGEKPDRSELRHLRDWIHASGTPIQAAAWGKFILAILNLYDWSGVTPVPPELYLLPTWVPVQPINISGYVRIVYLPMAYLYGRRWQAPLDPLLQEIRAELFPQGFDRINWPRHADRADHRKIHTFVSSRKSPAPDLRAYLLRGRAVGLHPSGSGQRLLQHSGPFCGGPGRSRRAQLASAPPLSLAPLRPHRLPGVHLLESLGHRIHPSGYDPPRP